MMRYNRLSVAERIFRGRGFYAALLPVRIVLSFLYRIIIYLKRELSSRDQVSTEKSISANVVSVGNIVVGGGGKTPCVMALAKALRDRGFKPVILSRGYGSRAEKAGKTVVLRGTGNSGSAGMPGREFVFSYGDEAAIYRNESVQVILDPNRKRGLKRGAQMCRPTHVIMDDAFQNLDIYKDHDILLLDHLDPFGGGKLLPWGSLRESPEAVKRAGVVIFTRSISNKIPPEARDLIKGKEIFFSRHEYEGLYGRDEEEVRPGELKGRKVAVFSGIAVPESFEDTVIERITEPDFSFRFSDHHMYDEEDIRFMTDLVPDGTVFITTEKDWFKSAELFTEDTDILVLKIRMVFDNIDRLVNIIESG